MRRRVWERWEREYRERRQRDDERRQEGRRQELVEARKWRGAEERAKKYEGWTTEELLREAGRRWGVEFFEGGAQPGAAALHPSGGVKVEVVEAGASPARGRAAYNESVRDVALRIIFHSGN